MTVQHPRPNWVKQLDKMPKARAITMGLGLTCFGSFIILSLMLSKGNVISFSYIS